MLLERVGADRPRCAGSDYPVGEKDPVGWLRTIAPERRGLAKVAGGTPRAFSHAGEARAARNSTRVRQREEGQP